MFAIHKSKPPRCAFLHTCGPFIDYFFRRFTAHFLRGKHYKHFAMDTTHVCLSDQDFLRMFAQYHTSIESVFFFRKSIKRIRQETNPHTRISYSTEVYACFRVYHSSRRESCDNQQHSDSILNHALSPLFCELLVFSPVYAFNALNVRPLKQTSLCFLFILNT